MAGFNSLAIVAYCFGPPCTWHP